MDMTREQVSRDRAPGVIIGFDIQQKKAEFETGIPVFVGFGKLTELALSFCKTPWCRITSWQQFEHSVEMAPIGNLEESFLPYAVRGFFENGGKCCVVLPLSETERSIEALAEPFLDSAEIPDGVVSSEISRKWHGMMENIEDIDLVCIPDLNIIMASIINPDWPEDRQRESVIKVQQQVLRHCKKMGDRFAILDAFPVLNDPVDMGKILDPVDMGKILGDRFSLSGAEGAIYFPWVYVQRLANPPKNDSNPNQSNELEKPTDSLQVRANNGGVRRVPPCGHVAGIYARSDAKIGVFKAPANELVVGVLGMEVSLAQNEQAELNHAGVNCFKSSPMRGIRVWGARTLSVSGPDQYVTTRRLFLTLVRWIEENMSDLVFEHNDSSLWRRIKNRLEGFCYQLLQKGALKGRAPEEAYYVKCDQELNTFETQQLGQVVCEIGLAAVVPSEFINVRITQSVSGVTASNLSLS